MSGADQNDAVLLFLLSKGCAHLFFLLIFFKFQYLSEYRIMKDACWQALSRIIFLFPWKRNPGEKESLIVM